MATGTAGTGGIVVEDGSGYDNSDSLASVEFADTFLTLVESTSTWHTSTDAVKGAALRKATMEWFEGQFQGIWRGTISVTDQFLSMPRIGLYDDEGRSYSSSAIPAKIQQAIALVANDTVSSSTTILPTGVVRGATVTEETKQIGTLLTTTRWSPSGNPTESALVAYLAAEALVFTFAESDNRNSVTVF